MSTADTTAMLRSASDTIRERRRALGISLVTLAIEAGYSPAYVTAIEAGYLPRSDAPARILAALDRLEDSEAAPSDGSAKPSDAPARHVQD